MERHVRGRGEEGVCDCGEGERAGGGRVRGVGSRARRWTWEERLREQREFVRGCCSWCTLARECIIKRRIHVGLRCTTDRSRPPRSWQKVVDTFVNTGADCKVRLVANDDGLRYILVLPSALLGPLASTFNLSGATQRGIRDHDAYMVLIARSPPSPPVFMGSFSDAFVLALYNTALELNERSTVLSWHRGQAISDRASSFLVTIREHAGAAQVF